MLTHREPIQIAFESYDPDEFLAWSANDASVVEPILSDTGCLGRCSTDVYRDQLGSRMSRRRRTSAGGGYNYAELKHARRLVQHGWPPQGIVYENFALSTRALTTTSGLRGAGCALVRDTFTPAFLEAFDAMVERHPELFAKTKIPLEARVDLFALDRERRRAGLWEVKRYNPNTRATEPIGDHQRAVLAFVTHLVRAMGRDALRDPRLELDVGLVVFVPHGLDDATRERAVAATDRYCDLRPWQRPSC